MKNEKSQLNHQTLQEWRNKIEIANQHNIFCHCRDCGYEWVDSGLKTGCTQCQSDRVERISCWQFPDD